MTETQTCSTIPNAQKTHRPAEPRRPPSELVDFARQYAHEKPEVVALWCLGIGFVLGWKLKFW